MDAALPYRRPAPTTALRSVGPIAALGIPLIGFYLI